MSLAHQLNVANVRLEIPWFLVEPSRGGFDWSRADYIFNSASAHGIVIQPILVYTPAWDGNYNSFPVAADFQAFVSTFIGRYGSRINAVEMWNEPDGGQSLVANNPAQYVQSILIPGYRGVKAVNPNVRVIEGGSINDSGTCCAWLSGVINAGGGAYFDIAAFHDYGGNYAQVTNAYRGLVGGKPIWLGEYGVSDPNGSQQSSLIQAAIAGTPGLAMAQFYTLRDESVYTCCPPAPAGEAKQYGVVLSDDVTKKSSFYTMQGLLGGSSPPPPPPPTPPPPPPASPPAASPTPQTAPSASPTPQHGGSQPSHDPGSQSQGAGSDKQANSSLPSSLSHTPAQIIAIVRSARSNPVALRSLVLRSIDAALLLIGIAMLVWGALRTTNIAALAGPRPRPSLFKPLSNTNVAIVGAGVLLTVGAIVLLVTQASSPL